MEVKAASSSNAAPLKAVLKEPDLFGNAMEWVWFVVWEPRDDILEMLKEENPGNLSLLFPYFLLATCM
jgi:hypothetical protein